MKKTKILLATGVSILSIGAFAGVVSYQYANPFYTRAQNTEIACSLTFDKDSVLNVKDCYFQESGLRLTGTKLAKGTGLNAIKIDAGGTLLTDGTSYDASKGFGSVANGLQTILIDSDSEYGKDYKLYVSYLDTVNTWNLLDMEMFECGPNQYPPRYFKIEAINTIEIVSMLVDCDMKTNRVDDSLFNQNLSFIGPTNWYLVSNSSIFSTKANSNVLFNKDSQTIEVDWYNSSTSTWSRETLKALKSITGGVQAVAYKDINQVEPVLWDCYFEGTVQYVDTSNFIYFTAEK